MGCDIHGVFQERHGNKLPLWVDIESKYEFNRHYQLFAVFAGVRNGFGFAGIPTGDSVDPISEPRGLPDDFVVKNGEDHPVNFEDVLSEIDRECQTDGEEPYVWMGDHSHSWLSGEELIEWRKKDVSATQCGVLSREEYSKWNGMDRPPSYCGACSGPDTIVIDNTNYGKSCHPNWTHIRCQWNSRLSDELGYFFDEVERLAGEHGSIRFVFGFDS